jgi:hypothetical protein
MLRYINLLIIHILITIPVFTQPAAGEDPPLMSDNEISARVASLGRLYKLDSSALKKLDKIITYDRDVFVGKIYNITFSEVRFTCPPKNGLTAMNKSEISQILYADGRRDVFIPLENRTVNQRGLVDTTRIIIKNQKDWMSVMVTEDPADVTHLTAMGNLKANYEASVGNAGNEELMRQALVILKKKAAVLKSHCVLIETKFFHKAYGDLPSVEVTARAFGY